jgi:hypothetical protein
MFHAGLNPARQPRLQPTEISRTKMKTKKTTPVKMAHLLGLAATPSLWTVPGQAAVTLDQTCVISVLNRTVQVEANGSWAMPNVPSFMGRIKARATCLQDGQTVSGESDYFNVVPNGIVTVGQIRFDALEQIPSALAFAEPGQTTLASLDATYQLAVTASYPDGATRDVTAAASGINYSSTNPAIAAVSEDGLVSAKSPGIAIVSARKDGALAVKRFLVSSSGDTDGDGLPDDYETAHGLNPNDPIDAQEDPDRDGLSNLDEFRAGTDIGKADTDGDGLADGEEVRGSNGFNTNPALFDSDGDGLGDGLEVRLGSSPLDPGSANYAEAVVSITVAPSSFSLTRNTIYNETTKQLSVMGNLVDGTVIDLTSQSRGTTYASSDLNVISLGITDGLLFAGETGNATVTVANNAVRATVQVSVTKFDPVALAWVDIPGYANNVDVAGNYAYVAAGDQGLQVVDVADKQHPTVVAGLDTPGTSIDVRVVGSLAYVADGNSGLQIIDIADPLHPQLRGTLDTPDIAQDLKVVGDTVYIADGNSGLIVVDASNPAQPALLGSLGGLGTAKGVDADGNRAVVVSDRAAHVVNVENRAQPALLGSATGSGLEDSKDVAVRGDFAYIAAYSSGWRVVDLSNPAAPTVVGGSGDFVPRDVELVDTLGLFAEQLFPNAIAYADIGDPRNAAFKGVIDLSGLGDYAGTGIALDDRYAYVTEESSFVGNDYETSGNTRLFIAQYRIIDDTGTVAPTVELTAPAPSSTLIEGERITLKANASDDVYVARVNFLVGGTEVNSDNAAPYEYIYTVPTGVRSLAFGATAVDLAGNVGTAPGIDAAVIPDPLTSVEGRVVARDGLPVVGAEIDCQGITTLSGPDGTFSLAGLSTVAGDIACSARFTDGQGHLLSGASGRTPPVRGGATLIGDIVVSDAVYETDIGAALDFLGQDDISAYVAFTQGFTFNFFGKSYGGAHVSSNGRVLFDFDDSTFTETLDEFNNQPQIDAFFDDLYPGRGGQGGVFLKQYPDRAVITWNNVPHYSVGGSDTIQMILFSDGRIQFGYNGITSTTTGNIVGVTAGNVALPSESDFSAAPFAAQGATAVYERFIGSDHPFDLDGKLLIFTPANAGGYNVDIRPLQ